MAKVTLANGTVIEGTIEEFKQMGVKFPVEEVEAEPLKVGDHIVALESADYMYGVTDTSMELGLVTKLCGDGEITIKIISHKDSSEVDCEFEVDTKHFRKATDEELVIAKEKQAEANAKLAEDMEQKKVEVKWAEIGRKPNEFKEGDIVRVVRVEGGICNGHPYGVIGEVLYDATPKNIGSGNPEVMYNGKSLCCNCELIAPVESRIDR
jgi:hypothetical protein